MGFSLLIGHWVSSSSGSWKGIAPLKQVVSSPPRVPDLLNLSKCVKHRLTLWCVFFKVFQTLDVHPGVDPCKGTPKLQCMDE